MVSNISNVENDLKCLNIFKHSDNSGIEIEERRYKQPHVMAEIGCNHMGEFEIAKELLTLAKKCGAA